MKFILEGIDGSGKSTLAKKIQETFKFMNFEIFHCTRYTPNNLKFFTEIILNNDNLIIDRMHIGQLVYQTEKERVDKGWMSNDDIIKFEEFLTKRSSVEPIIRIFVDTPLDTCLYNCHHNGEDGDYTYEYIKELRDKYVEILFKLNNNYGSNWISYDNNFPSPEVARNFDYSSLPHIVCVDFDKTLNLTNNSFPSIGVPNRELLDELLYGKYKDSKKVLYTCRTNDSLDEAIRTCEEWGLKFDAINDNIEELRSQGINPRKIYCNVFIDDLAVNPNNMFKD